MNDGVPSCNADPASAVLFPYVAGTADTGHQRYGPLCRIRFEEIIPQSVGTCSISYRF